MSETSHPLGLTLGSLELGILCSTVLYGTALIQTFNYYHAQFKGDHGIIKYLVAFVFILESTHTALLWIYLYTRTVTGFGEFEALDQVHWSLSISVPISCIIVLCVEGFFAYRIYVLSRNKYFPMLCVFGLLVRLGLGTAFAVTTPAYDLSAYFIKFRWLVSTALSVGAAVDIANTLGLCYVLRQNMSAQPRTKRIVDKLVLWTIETGMLTSVCAIIEVILMQTKDNLLWAFFFFQSAKFYSNSLLASLNGRALLQSIKEDSMTIALSTVNPQSTAFSRTPQNLSVHVDIETATDNTFQQSQRTIGEKDEFSGEKFAI
ncbi:hypothetical protein K435DRAFT_972179 [Dendrothele bispora CBS 962.96]|uniref:DUF6534 domain-containing protein n=1 Tax=Dendrothele bispora (strain CBS 962.96) TaxID=1314807 RepID=A0A4S8L0I4_DENBC|nr:hypothetical protein K435DRAFT_972179 [Dendrothele bispora CBS 962.96]